MLDLNERHLGWVIAKIGEWRSWRWNRQKIILAVSILNRCRGCTVKILTFHKWSTHLDRGTLNAVLKKWNLVVCQDLYLGNLISESWILGLLLIENKSGWSVWVDTWNVFDIALIHQMLKLLLRNWRCIICGRGSWLYEVRTCNSSSLDRWISNKGHCDGQLLIRAQDLLRLLLNVCTDKECFKRHLIIEGLSGRLLSRIHHLETLLVDIRLGLV